MSKNQRGFPPPALSQKTREIRPAYPASVDSNLDLAGPRLQTRIVFNVQLARCRVNQCAHRTSFIRTTGLGSRVSNRLQLDLAGRPILGALARVGREFLKNYHAFSVPFCAILPACQHLPANFFSTAPPHRACASTHWITVIAFVLCSSRALKSSSLTHAFIGAKRATRAHRPSSLCPSPSSRDTVPTGFGYVMPDQNGGAATSILRPHGSSSSPVWST